MTTTEHHPAPTTRTRFVADLAALRRRRGLPQSVVAARMGVAQQQLSVWESRRRAPSRRNLAAWAAALGVPPFPEAVDPSRPDCGTYRGYQMHTRLDEPPCDPCLGANAAYHRERRAARAAGVPTDPINQPEETPS